MSFQPVLVVAFALLAGCANSVYRLDAGVMISRANGDIALQGTGPTFDSGPKNDVDSALGLGGSTPSAFGRLQADADDNRFRIEGYALNTDGQGRLEADYGDILAGTNVDASLSFFTLGANWNHAIFRGENWRVGAGLQASFISLDLAARAAGRREETVTQSFVPMPLVDGELRFGNVSVGATFAGMYADVGDATGRFLDGELYARWLLSSEFQIFGGYRYILLDAAGKASDRKFDADVAIDGLFFGCGICF
ncbi:MAG: hypothetical protein ACK5AL_02705 [Planctomycetota bacterium]|jgi:hypothetical protein